MKREGECGGLFQVLASGHCRYGALKQTGGYKGRGGRVLFPSSTAQPAIELPQRLRQSDFVLIMFARISALSAFSVLALTIATIAAAACPTGQTALCCLTYANINIRPDI